MIEAGGLDLVFLRAGLGEPPLMLPWLLSLGLFVAELGPGLGFLASEVNMNKLEAGGLKPLASSFLSNPPGNLRPSIRTMDFILSTAVVERYVFPL